MMSTKKPTGSRGVGRANRAPHGLSIDFERMGGIIRGARLNKALTQEQLAELIDVTPAFIGHIERGERSLSLETLVKLSKWLNIHMDYLFSASDPAPAEKAAEDFKQLMTGRPAQTQEAILDLVRTALKYLE